MHPFLSKLPSAPASLSLTLRTILIAASQVAIGDAAGVICTFQHLPEECREQGYELSIVQAPPFIGIPRTLHSAAALQRAGIVGARAGLEKLERASLERRGDETFSRIYGRNTERVRRRLQDLHPSIEEWIVTHCYGGLLSRGGASLRERELAAVAMLSVDVCAGVQLASHLRGAVKAGASGEEVRCVVSQSGWVCGGAAEENAKGVLESYERARYAL